MNYQPLEPNISQPFLPMMSSVTDTVTGIATSVSFLWSMGIIICAAATGFVLMRGGLYRMEASEAGIRKSNDEFKRGTLGLLGVLSLFLIIYTVNKDLLVGDVGLSALKTTVTGDGGGAMLSGSSASCVSPETAIAAQKAGNICGNVSCRTLSGCNYQPYLQMIKSAAQASNIDPRIAVVIMCRESSANPSANRKNTNNTYDCGLMQVNQPMPCDTSSFDPATNIQKGVALIAQKKNSSSVSQTYPGVPSLGGLFASYNCCANGTTPNAPSADCNTSTGFSGLVPKWACPINPGSGPFNMCAVNAYACELTACLNNLPPF